MHDAFLFTHFMYRTPGPDLEQIQFSVSTDGLNWELLNRGNPVLENHGNYGGLRDPFPYRKKDGSFVILATDLNIEKLGNDWNAAKTAGSRDLILFESPDLLRWSPPRAVRLPIADATCAWAPEVADDNGVPLVIWSANRPGDRMRVYAAPTENFIDYGKPFVFVDCDEDAIDTTVCLQEGIYYRFTKKDSAQTVVMEKSPSLRGCWSSVPGYTLLSERGIEGPVCAILPSGRALLLLDAYGAGPGKSAYRAYIADDIASGCFRPADDEFRSACRMKHGSIMPITRVEYERLKQNFC